MGNDGYVYPCEECGKPINEGDTVIGIGKFLGRLISLPAGEVKWTSEIDVKVYHEDCAEDL